MHISAKKESLTKMHTSNGNKQIFYRIITLLNQFSNSLFHTRTNVMQQQEEKFAI